MQPAPRLYRARRRLRRPPRDGLFSIENVKTSKMTLRTWNLKKLKSPLNRIHSDLGINPSGLLSTHTYFGEYKTVYAWHTENMDASLANYLHYGEPRTWYSIPAHDAHRFELLLEQLISYPTSSAAPLRHNPIIATPQYLTEHGMRWHTVYLIAITLSLMKTKLHASSISHCHT